MKKFIGILISLTFILPICAFGATNNVTKIGLNESYWMKSSTKTDFFYKRYVHAGYLAIATLKHIEGTADFDIKAYSDGNFKTNICSSSASGPKTELLLLPIQNNSRYLYFNVKNYSGNYGKYELYIHEINIGGLIEDSFYRTSLEYIAEVAIKEILGIQDDSNQAIQNNANRAAITLVSQLQGDSLSDTSKGLLINEWRRAFTGKNDFFSSLVVNFGVALFDRIYIYT